MRFYSSPIPDQTGHSQADGLVRGTHKYMYTILHVIYRVSLAVWVAGGRVSRERECAVAGSRRSRCLRDRLDLVLARLCGSTKDPYKYSFPVCMRGNSGAPLGAPEFSRAPTDERRPARGLASHPPLQTATVLACARTPILGLRNCPCLPVSE